MERSVKIITLVIGIILPEEINLIWRNCGGDQIRWGVNYKGIIVFVSTSHHEINILRVPGRYRSRCRIPGNFLNVGTYHLLLALVRDTNSIELHEENIITFRVEEIDATKGIRGNYAGPWNLGVMRPKLDWKRESLGD